MFLTAERSNRTWKRGKPTWSMSWGVFSTNQVCLAMMPPVKSAACLCLLDSGYKSKSLPTTLTTYTQIILKSNHYILLYAEKWQFLHMGSIKPWICIYGFTYGRSAVASIIQKLLCSDTRKVQVHYVNSHCKVIQLEETQLESYIIISSSLSSQRKTGPRRTRVGSRS